jgi:hypothetical protein
VAAAIVLWFAGAVVLAVAAPADGWIAVILVVLGLIVVSMLQAHRQQRLVIRELRALAQRSATARATDEILDRLKLSALALGRLSEDVFHSVATAREAVARESADTYRRLAALHNLYAMLSVQARVPVTTDEAGSPEVWLMLVDLMRAERPRLVVACGSGASTLWCALAVQRFGLDTRIVALDDDAERASETRRLVAEHGVAEHVDVRYAPLEAADIDGHEVPWYARRAWADLDDIGLFVVVGCPPGTGAGRRAALALLGEQLAGGGAIVVDGPFALEEHLLTDSHFSVRASASPPDASSERGPMVLRREVGSAPSTPLPTPRRPPSAATFGA